MFSWLSYSIRHALILSLLAGTGSTLIAAEAEPRKAAPAAPRKVTKEEFATFPPLFLTEAKTFDPLDLARESWKGWISKRGIAWGLTPQHKPTLRLSFDCRALPWPSIKQHAVDGPDNNMRAIGGLAMLHAMLGEEFKNDPAAAGIIAYLQGCTDPVSGIPFNPDSIGRGCAIGHGEHTKNLVLMYQITGEKDWHEWAQRALKTLRYYAVESEEPGVGPVATYYQGGFTPGSEPVGRTGPETLGGWLHLALGWNLWAFSQWYEATDDRQALAFAKALGNRLYHGEDPNGNDGCFRQDGSFGGNSEKHVASWHMHGHTHCLPGVAHLGGQLIRAGEREEGKRFLNLASRSFDWLYDPARNPDAGSLTGWLGEWLMVATGWTRKADCEGCTVGDVVQTACALGAASRLDPSLASFTRYYDRAEQIYTGQLTEQRLRLTPAYLKLVRQNLTRRVERDLAGEILWQDQSRKGNHLRVARGEVQLASADLPNGRTPVLRFDGEDSFSVSNSAALRLAEFSIYVVVKASSGGEAQSLFCNYDNPINWGKGVNLQINPDRTLTFFTTDGTQANYDPMISTAPLAEGYHIVCAAYDRTSKSIRVDGIPAGSARSKPIDYGPRSIAAVGSLREFGFRLRSDLPELIVYDSVDSSQQAAVETYLSRKYGIPIPSLRPGAYADASVLWVKADAGFGEAASAATAEQKAREVERRYAEAVRTADRMTGQQMGACGFPDWVNDSRSDLDPELPGLHMQGCCADATIRGAHAVWAETVTGNAGEARVNLSFNRKSPLVDVISCLPHRGELNLLVHTAKKVLVRVPEWAPKSETRAYRMRSAVPVEWEGNYVVFANTQEGHQLTVIYPLRIAEIKETVGSLDGTEYRQRWRGNTIVDIDPPGKWLPMFQRPELDRPSLP